MDLTRVSMGRKGSFRSGSFNNFCVLSYVGDIFSYEMCGYEWIRSDTYWLVCVWKKLFILVYIICLAYVNQWVQHHGALCMHPHTHTNTHAASGVTLLYSWNVRGWGRNIKNLKPLKGLKKVTKMLSWYIFSLFLANNLSQWTLKIGNIMLKWLWIWTSTNLSWVSFSLCDSPEFRPWSKLKKSKSYILSFWDCELQFEF